MNAAGCRWLFDTFFFAEELAFRRQTALRLLNRKIVNSPPLFGFLPFDQKCRQLNAVAGLLSGDVLMALARLAPRMRMRAPPMEADSS